MRFSNILIGVTVILSSCLNDYEERVRVENVEAFNTIRLQSVFKVVLRNDPAYAVTIIADDDVINEVEFTWAGDTLIVRNKAKGKLMNPERNGVVLEISAPSFGRLIFEESYSLSNTGTLIVEDIEVWNYEEVKISEVDLNIEGNSFFYWNNWLSGGKLAVSGHVDSSIMYNYALHLTMARNLDSNYTTVYNFGREDCEVSATSRLTYGLHGPGNIIVYGHPLEMVELGKTSSGQLILGD